jgi:ABC-2 type transport system permease protein
MSAFRLNGSGSVQAPALPWPRRGIPAFVRDTLLITRRHLLRTWRTPQIMIFSAIMPVVFVLLFRYVFGGSIHVPGYHQYVDYLIPGIVVQTVLFGGSSTAVGMAEDLASGMTDRFRSLPVHRGAILAARTLGDLLRLSYTVALVVSIGFLVGFRFHAGVVRVAEGLGIALLFGYACSWLFALVAMTARQTETAQMAAFLLTFPIVFASSIFASPATMPPWLRDFANAQPVTKVVDALRTLGEGSAPATRPALYALAWSVGILLVAATAATLRFRRD